MRGLSVRRAQRTAQMLRMGFTRRVTVGSRSYRTAPMRIDLLAAAATNVDHYEGEMTALFRRLLASRDGAVVDVGANIGQTLLKILSIDPTRRYLGIEPQGACAADLQRFVRDNGLVDHDVVVCGLSDAPGVAMLSYESPNDARASLVDDFRPEGLLSRRMPVPVLRGDDLLRAMELDPVALVKIDVEGGELEVLRGLVDTLSQQRPFVTLEVLPNRLVSTGAALDSATVEVRRSRFSATTDLMHSAGYDLALVGRGGSLTSVDSLEPDPGGAVRNVLASPRP